MRLDWVDGEGAEVTATWTNPESADEAPSRPLDRADFLPFPAEPPTAPAPARDEDDDRPKPRRALS